MANEQNLAIDANDVLHMVVSHIPNIYHMRNTGLGWETEFVTTGKDGAIAVSASGEPHVFYYSPSPDWLLMHAWKENGAWRTEIVHNQPHTFRNVKAAVDADGDLHVIHHETQPYRVWYSLKQDGAWTNHMIREDVLNWHQASLAVEPNGTAHLALGHHTTTQSAAQGLYYGTRAKEADAAWSFELVHKDGYGYVSLDVDASGNPHVAHALLGSNPQGRLLYTHKDGGVWQTEKVDIVANTGYYTSIDVTPQGRPHITHWQGTSDVNNPLAGHLRYSVKTAAGEWSNEFVTPIGLAGNPSVLKLDSWGLPHIAYHYTMDQLPEKTWVELRYAEPVAATLLRTLQQTLV